MKRANEAEPPIAPLLTSREAHPSRNIPIAQEEEVAAMSTPKRPSRLVASMLSLGIGFAVAGCSSTNNFRLGQQPPSQAKTTLAVGDRPLAVVTGTPGSSIAADTDVPIGPKRLGSLVSMGRVSGRVYDTDGKPVPNARVRLAVSGALGGKDVQATTDASGAFTLRGLRPGSTYTVIAESDEGNAKLIGRSQVRSSDSDVRISLAADESTTPTSSPGRVRGVSDRTEDEDEDQGPPRIEAGVNEEDLPPAAEVEAEAEAQLPIARTRDVQPPRRKSSTSPNKSRRDWGAGSTEKTRSAPPREEAGPSLDPDTRGTAAAPPASDDLDDDGPNPLPPALERPAPKPSSDPPPPRNEEAFVPRPWPKPASEPPAEPAPLVFDSAQVAASEQETETRSEAASSAFESGVPVGWPNPVVKREQPSWGETAPEPLPLVAAQTDEPAAPSSSSIPPLEQPKRPAWGDIADTVSEPARSGRFRRIEPGVTRTSTHAEPEASTIFCDYDERHHKLNDFRLPDLEGKLVRFKDIDADLVLIDFWGTWCAPCLDSIPHLVGLQERMKGKKVVVLGIACEREAPDVAKAQVTAAVRKLNINYPVLLTRDDGSCPIQRALGIQAFPTMLLVDRQGRVLWRDQGATTATLNRLDRVLTDSFGVQTGKN